MLPLYPVNSILTKLRKRRSRSGGPVYLNKAFAALDFAATLSMTWSVDAADQTLFKYVKLGKKLLIAIRLNNTTIGGTVAGANLTIKMPDGLLAAQVNEVPFTGVLSNVPETVFASVAIGSNLITVRRASLNWVAGTNNVDVAGYITVDTTT